MPLREIEHCKVQRQRCPSIRWTEPATCSSFNIAFHSSIIRGFMTCQMLCFRHGRTAASGTESEANTGYAGDLAGQPRA